MVLLQSLGGSIMLSVFCSYFAFSPVFLALTFAGCIDDKTEKAGCSFGWQYFNCFSLGGTLL